MSLATLRDAHPWPSVRPDVPRVDHGWLDEGTARILTDACQIVGDGAILELGAWLGKSTRHLLANAPMATVIAVDHWDAAIIRPWIASRHPHLLPVVDAGVRETFLVNCGAHRARLIPMQAHTLAAIAECAREGVAPALVYLDSSHGYNATVAETRAILAAFPDTALVGDDWDWAPEKDYPVRRAVRAVLGDDFGSIHVDGNGWAVRCVVCGSHRAASAYRGREYERCRDCGALRRHRRMVLMTRRHGLSGPILHVAPEVAVKESIVRRAFGARYVTLDIDARHGMNVTADLTHTRLPAESFGTIVASHVLEHIVDADAAIRECFRLLRPGGLAYLDVPIVGITTARLDPPGDHGHVWAPGRDWNDRYIAAGFEVLDAHSTGLTVCRRPGGAS